MVCVTGRGCVFRVDERGCEDVETRRRRRPIEQKILAFHAKAGRAWPKLHVEAATFAAHLWEVVDPSVGLDESLEKLHGGDLYLVCAGLEGDAEALAELDRLLTRSAASPLRRVLRTPEDIDDALQILRRKLLTAEDGALRLADYAGRGPLEAWLRATAARVAIDLQRARRSSHSAGDRVLALLSAPDADPEMLALTSEHRAAFEVALRRALSGLSSRERNALRLSTVDSLSLEAIGRLYAVNKSTVSRWLAQARQRVRAEVYRTFEKDLRIRGPELESYLGTLDRRLEASVTSLLQVSRASKS
jgi:RNA polymerase sigma-70 factor (ECF subfamily)